MKPNRSGWSTDGPVWPGPADGAIATTASQLGYLLDSERADFQAQTEALDDAFIARKLSPSGSANLIAIS
jgi:hypothetical protein